LGGWTFWRIGAHTSVALSLDTLSPLEFQGLWVSDRGIHPILKPHYPDPHHPSRPESLTLPNHEDKSHLMMKDSKMSKAEMVHESTNKRVLKTDPPRSWTPGGLCHGMPILAQYLNKAFVSFSHSFLDKELS
jgi:hypothetical protein